MVATGAALVGRYGAAFRTRKHRRHYGFTHPIFCVNGDGIRPGCVRWVVTKVGIKNHFLHWIHHDIRLKGESYTPNTTTINLILNMIHYSNDQLVKVGRIVGCSVENPPKKASHQGEQTHPRVLSWSLLTISRHRCLSRRAPYIWLHGNHTWGIPIPRSAWRADDVYSAVSGSDHVWHP